MELSITCLPDQPDQTLEQYRDFVRELKAGRSLAINSDGIIKAMESYESGGPWACYSRAAGSGNCPCARFDDGSCVPPWVYPEFSKRRDAGESFRDRGIYNAQNHDKTPATQPNY